MNERTFRRWVASGKVESIADEPRRLIPVSALAGLVPEPAICWGRIFPFGTNGIRLDPNRGYVYLAVSTSGSNPALGTIYRLPLVNNPQPGDLEVVHNYAAGEGPDQLAFGNNGQLYVTLAFSNQISILAPGGGEIGRIASQPGDEVPLDNPAGIAFDSRTKSLLLVNHALLSGNPAHFAVLSVYVGDPGDPLSQP